MNVEAKPEQPTPIEVGVADGGLRYWRAKEAIRHAELRINGQTANLAAMESRATSILGWAIAGLTALIAVSTVGQLKFAATAGAASLFFSSVLSIIGLKRKDWGMAGYPPKDLIEDGHGTELEVLETVGLGYEDTIDLNDNELSRFANYLTASWLLFAATPILAAAVGFLTGSIWASSH